MCIRDRSPAASATGHPDNIAASESGSTSIHSGSGSSGRETTETAPSRSEPDRKHPNKTEAVSPSEWRRKNFKPRSFSQFEDLRGYEEVRGLSPQPPTQTTVRSGEKLYSQACIACHNLDGSPLRRDPALLKYNMADLSEPGQYQYGSTPRAIYRSIRYGVPSPPMGFTGSIYSRTEVWDMVNYIQSLQKKRR